MQAVRAVCHLCRILLVEASAPTSDHLASAENTAARMGATEISNSFGTYERRGHQFSDFVAPRVRAPGHRDHGVDRRRRLVRLGLVNAGINDVPGGTVVPVVVALRSSRSAARSSCSTRTARARPSRCGTTTASTTRSARCAVAWARPGRGAAPLLDANPWQRAAPNYAHSGCNGKRFTADVSAVAAPVDRARHLQHLRRARLDDRRRHLAVGAADRRDVGAGRGSARRRPARRDAVPEPALPAQHALRRGDRRQFVVRRRHDRGLLGLHRPALGRLGPPTRTSTRPRGSSAATRSSPNVPSPARRATCRATPRAAWTDRPASAPRRAASCSSRRSRSVTIVAARPPDHRGDADVQGDRRRPGARRAPRRLRVVVGRPLRCRPHDHRLDDAQVRRAGAVHRAGAGDRQRGSGRDGHEADLGRASRSAAPRVSRAEVDHDRGVVGRRAVGEAACPCAPRGRRRRR